MIHAGATPTYFDMKPQGTRPHIQTLYAIVHNIIKGLNKNRQIQDKRVCPFIRAEKKVREGATTILE